MDIGVCGRLFGNAKVDIGKYGVILAHHLFRKQNPQRRLNNELCSTDEDIPTAFLRHYPAYKSGSLNLSELARVCDISRTTAYKYIGLLEM